jgi:SAM-dependent methyltransferase
LLEEKGGIRLDIGSGPKPQPGFVGMDVRDLPGVDIVHDVIDIPWPLPDECVLVANAAHLVEHIPPSAVGPDGKTWFPFMAFMDEVWRVMRPEGHFIISAPHGNSQGYLQDPSHVNPCNENTFWYFCPEHFLYRIYEPRPWKMEFRTWSPTTNIEIILSKLPEGGKENGEAQV